jgi:F5/8 type C domain
VLLDSLRAASAVPANQVYPGDADCSAGDQWCADSVIHRAMGGITHDKIQWQNRPTYQQVVQFPARRGNTLANVALSKTATASSHERGAYNSPPANAVDGNPATRWASDWSDDLQVDLGAVQRVGRAFLRWEASFAKGYRIEVSTNGTQWRQVFATAEGNGVTDNVSFTPTDARFVRMTGTQRGTNYGYSLYELEVYPQ